MTTSTCYRYDGDWFARNRHDRDCNTSGCPGCEPCPERHCQLCNRQHVTIDGRGSDLTCATCLGTVRDHLKGLVVISTAIFGEALMQSINGHAAGLAGPIADIEAWGYRRQSALGGRIDPRWLDDQVDLLHPAWVLGTWERAVREHLEQVLSPGTSQPTLTEARDYLDQHLTRLAHDESFGFDELAVELRDCFVHVERVVHLEEHHDTGVPCPACGRAKLERNYGGGTVDHDDLDDRWTCPRCKQWWTESDYRAKVDGIYAHVATALTASQISETYRVNEHTVRTWAERGKVHRRGKDAQGRMLYDVAEVLATRDGDAPSSSVG